MRVSELSERTGVSIHRLRRWETGGLLTAVRTERGERRFGEESVRVVTFVAMARDLGFGLDEVARVVPDYVAGRLGIDDLVGILQERLTDIDHQIDQLQAQRQQVVDHVAWFEARRPRPIPEEQP